MKPISFHNRQDPDIGEAGGAVTHPLGSKDNGMAVAFSCKDYGNDAAENIAPTLRSMNNSRPETRNGGGQVAVQQSMQVRRLTPRECERLQGFPDDFTLVPHRGKPAADGARYKALGNSMAVPCMRWLGERIAMVDGLACETAEAQENTNERRDDQRVRQV